jgi:DNA-directed RNA polymerase specialized sigma24 family protein
MNPNALDGLVRTCQDETLPPATRDAALEALIVHYQAGHAPDPLPGQPRLTEAGQGALAALTRVLREPIERVAQQAAHRAGCWESDPHLAEELRNDALAEVLLPRACTPARICTWRPDQGSLAAWLHKVLTNVRRDRQREKQKFKQVSPNVEQQMCGGEPEAEVLCEPWLERLGHPFSAADLKELAGWSVQVRLELLCLAGLAHKVPAQSWEEWLTAWEGERGRSLSRPFPPIAFATLDEPCHRVRPLAGLLGCPVNTLVQRWRRHRERLGALEFVRDLQPA